MFPNFQIAREKDNKQSSLHSILKKMDWYLSLDIICYSELTVFLKGELFASWNS